MPKLRIDLSGIQGLSTGFIGARDSYGEESNYQYLSPDGSFNSGRFNPFRRPGLYSPAINASKNITASTSFDAIMGSSQFDAVNNDFYMAERGTAIFKGDRFNDNELGETHNITGATITDLEIYQVNGSTKIFYAYQKAGGGDIGTADLPMASENDDAISTDATGGTALGATNEIAMEVADNGFMYIIDGSTVHKFDGTTDGGTNGTLTPNVLTFPAPFQLVDLFDYRGNMLLALIENTDNTRVPLVSLSVDSESYFAGIYFWDRSSTVTSSFDFVPIEGVRDIKKIFALEGELHCITVSTQRLTQIRRWNGTNFKIIETLPLFSEPIYRDSVFVDGDILKWVGSDGSKYWYGRVTPDSDRAFYRLGHINGIDTTGGSAEYAGAIIGGGSPASLSPNNGDHDAYYISTKTGASTYQVRRWHPFGLGTLDSVSQAGDTTEAKTKVYPLPKLSNINNITLFFQPNANSAESTATEWTFKVYKNMKTSSEVSFDVARNETEKGYHYENLGINDCSFLQLSLTHSGSGVSNDSTAFPVYAEIDYEPTTKLK